MNGKIIFTAVVCFGMGIFAERKLSETSCEQKMNLMQNAYRLSLNTIQQYRSIIVETNTGNFILVNGEWKVYEGDCK